MRVVRSGARRGANRNATKLSVEPPASTRDWREHQQSQSGGGRSGSEEIREGLPQQGYETHPVPWRALLFCRMRNQAALLTLQTNRSIH
jgi:hypothetical protein